MGEPLIKFKRQPALISPRTAPELYHVNKDSGRPTAPPTVGGSGGVVPFQYRFYPDGFVFPRADDIKFDVTIRDPSIDPNATSELDVWDVETNIKGGVIRRLGYGFNNPHGEFVVRTFLLINNAPPSDYQFRTVDAATGTFEGSFPTSVIGPVEAPTEVYIRIPAQSRVSIRFQNNSLAEAFEGTVRLAGWFFPS